jgi:hypothetical protein
LTPSARRRSALRVGGLFGVLLFKEARVSWFLAGHIPRHLSGCRFNLLSQSLRPVDEHQNPANTAQRSLLRMHCIPFSFVLTSSCMHFIC